MSAIRRTIAAWVVAAATASAGCMTVHIDSAGAPVRVVRHFGSLRIELPPADTAVVGTLSGTGIAATPLGWSAGHTRQRWAAVGPQCRAILWLSDAAVGIEARTWLSSLAGVCLFDEPARTDRASPAAQHIAATRNVRPQEEP